MGNTAAGSRHSDNDGSSPLRNNGPGIVHVHAMIPSGNDTPLPSPSFPTASYTSPPRGNHDSWQHYSFPFGLSPPCSELASQQDRAAPANRDINQSNDVEAGDDGANWSRRYYFPMMCSPPNSISHTPSSSSIGSQSPNRSKSPETNPAGNGDDTGTCYGTPRSSTSVDRDEQNEQCEDSHVPIGIQKDALLTSQERPDEKSVQSNRMDDSFPMTQDDSDDEDHVDGNNDDSNTASSYPLSQEGSPVDKSRPGGPCTAATNGPLHPEAEFLLACNHGSNPILRNHSEILVAQTNSTARRQGSMALANMERLMASQGRARGPCSKPTKSAGRTRTLVKASRLTRKFTKDKENRDPPNNLWMGNAKSFRLQQQKIASQSGNESDASDDFAGVSAMFQKLRQRRLSGGRRHSTASMETHPATSPRDSGRPQVHNKGRFDDFQAYKDGAMELKGGEGTTLSRKMTDRSLVETKGATKIETIDDLSGHSKTSKRRVEDPMEAFSSTAEVACKSTVKPGVVDQNADTKRRRKDCEGRDRSKWFRAAIQERTRTSDDSKQISESDVQYKRLKASPSEQLQCDAAPIKSESLFKKGGYPDSGNKNHRETLLERYPEYEGIARRFEHPKIF